jgi:O-antigen ligase
MCFLYQKELIEINKTEAKLIILVLGTYLASGMYHLYVGALGILQGVSVLLIFSFSVINIFIVPKVLDIRLAAWILSTIAAFSVLAGIPPLFIGEYTFYGFHFAPYGQPAMFPITDGLNSYFEFMNGMNRLTVYGFFSALFLSLESSSRVQKLALAINGAGVILSSRRQTILLLILLLPIAMTYWHNAGRVRKWVPQYFYLTLTGGIVTLLILVTTPLSVPLIDINTRMEIWKEMWVTIVDNPVVGTGPREFLFSPHSGYLLAGVTSGIIGLVSYILVPIVVFRHVSQSVSRQNLYAMMILYATFIFQFFEIYNFVGINFDSTLTAIFIGMLIVNRSE